MIIWLNRFHFPNYWRERLLLENVLRSYKGALLLVSHDEAFTENCAITHTLTLA